MMEEALVIDHPPFKTALVAGGAAGLSVDISMFPLDTIKTRLQSSQGFFKAGGFRGIYSGLPSTVVGSVPTAALFFCSYEGVKGVLSPRLPEAYSPFIHMLGASAGEVTACIVRVPCEVVKQRAQAAPHVTTLHVLQTTLQQEGFRGLFRGYLSTVVREVPFSFIQMPLWELLKKRWTQHQGHPLDAWQSSVCGGLAGSFSGAITTPLDVAKTRIMLAERGSALAHGSILYALKLVWQQRGIKGLFAGIVPRVMWISIGGAIFLGVYDRVKTILMEKET